MFHRLRRRAGRRSGASFLARIDTGEVTREELRARAAPYPTEILAGCESALVLFGAAFLGVNDAIHFANAAIRAVTVVDIDGAKLDTMRPLYPSEWEFISADAFAFVGDRQTAGARYDVVSADPFTSLMPRVREAVPALCALAGHAVVVGVERGQQIATPPGWHHRRVERSDLADWIVLEPSARGHSDATP